MFLFVFFFVVVMGGFVWIFELEEIFCESWLNFVVVLCDDLGYGDFGCYGYLYIEILFFDELVGEGF